MNYNILETRLGQNGKIYYDIEILSIDKICTFKFDADISDDLIETEVARFVRNYEMRLATDPIEKKMHLKMQMFEKYYAQMVDLEMLMDQAIAGGIEDEKIIEYTEEIEKLKNLMIKLEEERDVLSEQIREIVETQGV